MGFTIQMRLAEAFQAFASSVLASCNIPDSVTSLPIQFETPVRRKYLNFLMISKNILLSVKIFYNLQKNL